MPKKKRKNNGSQQPTAPPAKRRMIGPMPPPPAACASGRQVVSYDDIETEPAPPVPRQQAEGDDASVPDSRHQILSREAKRDKNAGHPGAAQPRTDATYGQMNAFPGLDEHGDEAFYGPANDGLDYLRMVRSEAKDIPHIVTSTSKARRDRTNGVETDAMADEGGTKEEGAPQSLDWEEYAGQGAHDHDKDDEDDYDYDYDYDEDDDSNGYGYYEDGAYIARSLDTKPSPAEASTQDLYHARIYDIYLAHRQRLHAAPPAGKVTALPQSHPITFPTMSKLAHKEWRSLISTTQPLPAQVCSMDSKTALRVLRLCEGQLQDCGKRGINVHGNVVLWIWALLGRLDEPGLLTSEQVSAVRDLGKVAGWVGVALRNFGENSARGTDELGGSVERASQAEEPEEDWPAAEEREEEVADLELADIVEESVRRDVERLKKNFSHMSLRALELALVQHAYDYDIACAYLDELDEADALARCASAGAGKEEEEVADGHDAMDITASVDIEDMFAAKRKQMEAEQQEALEEQEEQSADAVPSANTCALLDMIITVAGEFYGQRDLLESRQRW